MTIPITTGSANIFSDLGLPDAEELYVKAKLAHQIALTIRERNLTQSVAAARMGISQPKLSNILRGKLQGVSEDRLMRCLASLGRNVTITLSQSEHEQGKVEVVCSTPAKASYFSKPKLVGRARRVDTELVRRLSARKCSTAPGNARSTFDVRCRAIRESNHSSFPHSIRTRVPVG
jgi:predicted XRE-type DNA-binding protein